MKHPLPWHGGVRSTQSPSFPGAKTHAMPAPVHVVTGSSVFELLIVAGGQAHARSEAKCSNGERRILDVYHALAIGPRFVEDGFRLVSLPP
jgi:hypothetical protein